MSIISEFTSLSTLRKNQQIMAFFLLFVNTMLVAVTATFYIGQFGVQGVILKDYAISFFALVLFVPALGKFAVSSPLRTFRVSLAMEFLSVVGYLLVSLNVTPEILLPVATVLIVSSNLLMRPVLTQVDSLVTNGEASYSLFKSKMDALYTAIGAGVGALFILFSLPTTLSISVYATSLLMARLYRKKVLEEIYQTEGDMALSESHT